MIIDLEDFRPRNESFEHFFLKQVGRAYLFKQGIRCIATEVSGASGYDHPPFGEPKSVVDVFGIDYRRKSDDMAKKLYQKIQDLAIRYGEEYGVTEPGWSGNRQFVGIYKLKEPERTATEKIIEVCFERACKQLGYPSELYKKIQHSYRDAYQMRSIEVKVSLQDFRNGFSIFAEYAYVLAPKGIVPINELPIKVGLLEFDFDIYQKEGKWEKALALVKRPKKEYDSMFYHDAKNRKHLDLIKHHDFCRKLLFTVSQQNTEEHIFWNPHIRAVKEKYTSSNWEGVHFQYRIGDRTPLGIVIDRRVGKNPDPSANPYSYWQRQLDFYKLVVEGKGLTGWIPRTEIEKSMKKKREIKKPAGVK